MEIYKLEIWEKGPRAVSDCSSLICVNDNKRAEKNWHKFKLANSLKSLSHTLDQILDIDVTPEVVDKGDFDDLFPSNNTNTPITIANTNILTNTTNNVNNTHSTSTNNVNNRNSSTKNKSCSETSIKPFDLLLDKFCRKIDCTLIDRIPKLSQKEIKNACNIHNL